jgi:hypothetical protein
MSARRVGAARRDPFIGVLPLLFAEIENLAVEKDNEPCEAEGLQHLR